MNFISDYFAWCIYKLRRKRKEEQEQWQEREKKRIDFVKMLETKFGITSPASCIK